MKNSGTEIEITAILLWRQDPEKIHLNFERFGDHLAVSTRLITQMEVAVKGCEHIHAGIHSRIRTHKRTEREIRIHTHNTHTHTHTQHTHTGRV